MVGDRRMSFEENIEKSLDKSRLWKYEVRDDYHGYYNGVGNKIFEHKFCIDCRSKECSNKSHNHIELHPIIRIPKQTANKKKWKQFFELVEYFGESNIRHKRH
jgi:hypothetical protein